MKSDKKKKPSAKKWEPCKMCSRTPEDPSKLNTAESFFVAAFCAEIRLSKIVSSY